MYSEQHMNALFMDNNFVHGRRWQINVQQHLFPLAKMLPGIKPTPAANANSLCISVFFTSSFERSCALLTCMQECVTPEH